MSYCKAIQGLYPSESMESYYGASVDQKTPFGKLYFKVVNINYKRRMLGELAKGIKSSRNKSRDLSRLDDMDDGMMLASNNMFGMLFFIIAS